ncbi:hypothetical protein [Terribacillus saccharophilus]|uniref:hypothetical protein n=1 Tax=Terribacillus saccharophilus TaxID=361277 RepID=UPI000C9C0C53|nr:hypothetical protein [Terribacillus goriensis]
MKMAYFFDPETLEHTYDQIQVEADENGEYQLPVHGTWKRPAKGENEYFILALWNSETEEWEEGGTPREPEPYQPSDAETLGQELAIEKLNRMELQISTDELGRQLAEEKLKTLAKDSQLQQQEQSIQELGQQIAQMRLQNLLNEGSK